MLLSFCFQKSAHEQFSSTKSKENAWIHSLKFAAVVQSAWPLHNGWNHARKNITKNIQILLRRT